MNAKPPAPPKPGPSTPRPKPGPKENSPAGYTSQPYSVTDGTYGYEPARIPESAAAEYVARQLRTRRAAA